MICHVCGFREVLRYLVQLPHVLIERQDHVDVPGHALGMQRYRLPAIHPDRAVTEHFVVLPLFSVCCIGIIERIHHRNTIEWLLLHTVIGFRHLDARSLHDGRRDIADVMVLTPDLALCFDAVRPVNDQCVSLTTTVFALLEIAKRGVACHRPAGVIMRIGVLSAPVIKMTHIRVEWGLHPIQYVSLIECAGQATFATGAIVGSNENQCVVQLANTLELLQYPANLMIDMFHLRGEGFHLPCIQSSLFLAQRVPGRDLVNAIGE